ncbi:MAG: efflux RND transporter periplasmic adaptor subunit [Phycisphaerales bacterium]|nr:efflux RND transporter periplasmic adaptor subunit [Phycisphaerales bacterium]
MDRSPNLFIVIITRSAVCLLLLAIGAGGFMAIASMRKAPATSDPTEELRRVLVLDAVPQSVARIWEGFGNARAMDEADVPARVTSTAVFVAPDLEPGTAVKEGDVLVRLDPSDFQRQVEVSEYTIANLVAQREQLDVERASWEERLALSTNDVRLAEAELARAKEALRREAANDREVDIAEQAVVQARQAVVNATEQLNRVAPRRASLDAQIAAQEATRRIATQNLERCTIAAPLSGVLQAFDVELGENVVSGSRIARIVNTDRVEVPVRVPSGARPFIRVGDPATLMTTGSLHRTWDASIARVAPEDDASTRTMTVYVELHQDTGDGPRLAPGMFVQAMISEHMTVPRSVIPSRSLQDGQIIVVRDGVVARETVEIAFQMERAFSSFGVPDREWIVLEHELSPNTQVVVTATRSLTDGMRVEPVSMTQAAARSNSGVEAESSVAGTTALNGG